MLKTLRTVYTGYPRLFPLPIWLASDDGHMPLHVTVIALVAHQSIDLIAVFLFAKVPGILNHRRVSTGNWGRKGHFFQIAFCSKQHSANRMLLAATIVIISDHQKAPEHLNTAKGLKTLSINMTLCLDSRPSLVSWNFWILLRLDNTWLLNPENC